MHEQQRLPSHHSKWCCFSSGKQRAFNHQEIAYTVRLQAGLSSAQKAVSSSGLDAATKTVVGTTEAAVATAKPAVEQVRGSCREQNESSEYSFSMC